MSVDIIWKALRNPLKACDVLILLARGQYYKLKYTVGNKNVQIGKRLKVRAKLSIKGPGKVIIGDDVYIDGTSHAVTPWTNNKEAEIIIGNNVFVNGARFGCSKRIEVGHHCILADCRILDTDFHSTNPLKRNDPEFIESAPIKIGNNVWIALGGVILKGVTIGDNSTVAAQSVVHNNVEANAIYAGNPAVLIKRLPG
jgi:acetyltransferase-like isoleucine patch superfamily enzyme